MANEKKTKEELTEVVFCALRSGGGMDINPQLDFEELLPEYEQEVKNILAEIILRDADEWSVYKAMYYLITFFATASITSSLFLSILERIVVRTDSYTQNAREFAKIWIAQIADVPDCKSKKFN